MNDTALVPRQRPLGVTIIAVLLAILGILSILGAIFLFTGSSMLASHSAAAGGLLTGAGIVAVIAGVIDLLLAWGLWTLKKWAFWVTAVLEALSFIANAISLVGGNHSALTIIQTLLALAIVVYLFADRNVRAAFRTA